MPAPPVSSTTTGGKRGWSICRGIGCSATSGMAAVPSTKKGSGATASSRQSSSCDRASIGSGWMPTPISPHCCSGSCAGRSSATRSSRPRPARSTSSTCWSVRAISSAAIRWCGAASSSASPTSSWTNSRTPIRCRRRSSCCSPPTTRPRPTGGASGRCRAACSWSAIRSSRSTGSAGRMSASTARSLSSCGSRAPSCCSSIPASAACRRSRPA